MLEVCEVLQVSLAQTLCVEAVPGEDESSEVGSGLGPAPGQQRDVISGEVEILQLGQLGQGGHRAHLVAAQVQPGEQEKV